MMDIKFSPWSALIGLLFLLMIASMLHLLPITYWFFFWLVIIVACIWALKRIFYPEKKE